MKKPKALVFSGYGLNCEDETAYALRLSGAEADIFHINNLIANKGILKRYQIAVVPGGFAFGDDTGSGKAYANKMKNHLKEEMEKFLERDTLLAGICNGFQVLTNFGVLPGALLPNASARYSDRWTDLKITSKSPWLSGIKTLMVPIAHGEGRYYADSKTIAKLKKEGAVVAICVKGEVSKMEDWPATPNGSLHDIGGGTSHNGRVFGMMPHPERAMFFTQLPHWTNLREEYARKSRPLPKFGPGLQIFKNAVEYF